MSFINMVTKARDHNIIRAAYKGQTAKQEGAASRQHHRILQDIGRRAAEDGLSLSEAYELYDEYMEGLDAAVEGEIEEEGEDPANLDEPDWEDDDD